jgi:DNA-binding transcriptional ArsR family regulator
MTGTLNSNMLQVADLPRISGPTVLPQGEMEVNRTAHAVKAMAHPLRLQLLCILGTREISVQDLTRRVHRTSQSNISQHLSQMLERGILDNRKVGNQVLYRIRDTRVLTLIGMMKAVFCPD